jgi:DNA-directed RNA polymerase specialized sigma24 family protein|tara:strand:- start:73 stop:363 length:291 start_codon:yes stop_codon:yes gene_type:complete
MLDVSTSVTTASVKVVTSDNGGLTNEQVAELATDAIISVSDNSPPEIREQAQVFKEQIRKILLNYMLLARQQERATLSRKLVDLGYSELAAHLGRL